MYVIFIIACRGAIIYMHVTFQAEKKYCNRWINLLVIIGLSCEAYACLLIDSRY